MFRFAISALLLVACSTNVPDIHPLQAAEEDSTQSAVVNAGTERTYVTPVYRGNFSSEKIRYSSSSRAVSSSLKMSSSQVSSSSSFQSSSSMKMSSSSMVELLAGDIDWTGDCMVDFGLTAGEHAISWNVSGVGCSGLDIETGALNYVYLFCETESGESGGASLTLDGTTYEIGMGVEFSFESALPPALAGGGLQTYSNLICHFK